MPMYDLRVLTLDPLINCNKCYDPVKEHTWIAHKWDIIKQISPDGNLGIKTFSFKLGWNKCRYDAGINRQV